MRPSPAAAQASGASAEFLAQKRVSRSAYAVTEGTPLAAYMGTCEQHQVPVREDVTPDQAVTRHRMITCFISGTPHQVRGERLVGVVTALECDGSCRGARGQACSCGCGGVNHGNTWTRGAFISRREEVESALAKYRKHLAKLEAARIKRAEARSARQAEAFAAWAADEKISALITWLSGDHAYTAGNFIPDMQDMIARHEILTANMIDACRRIWLREHMARRAAGEVTASGAPVAAPADGPPATPNQLRFLATLLRERDLPAETPATKQEASARIDALLGTPKASAPAATPAAPAKAGAGDQATLTPGVYKLDGRIYVVKGNKTYAAWRKAAHAALKAGQAAPARPSGANLYAKQLTESAPRVTEAGTEIPFELTYAPGVIHQLAVTDMMPRAEAEELSTRYARCIVCGRHLKAAKSVRAAIGPVCGKYFRD